MAGSGSLGFKEAARIIAEVALACAARTGALPHTIVAVGGTALAARSVRDLSHDVDVFLDNLDDDAVAAVAARHAKHYGSSFKIDATPSENIWGAIAIRDIAKSPLVATVMTNSGPIEIRALTVETLFLVKAAADREKDRADLASLARHTTYDHIIQRARIVFPWYGDRQTFPDFVERLGRYVGEHFAVPLATVDRDFRLSPGIAEKVAERRRALEEQYWPAIKELMRAAPQHLRYEARDPRHVTFDAKAAGAPEIVLRMMKSHPQRASDLAAEMLRVADPGRNTQRLLALKKMRDSRGPAD